MTDRPTQPNALCESWLLQIRCRLAPGHEGNHAFPGTGWSWPDSEFDALRAENEALRKENAIWTAPFTKWEKDGVTAGRVISLVAIAVKVMQQAGQQEVADAIRFLVKCGADDEAERDELRKVIGPLIEYCLHESYCLALIERPCDCGRDQAVSEALEKGSDWLN